MKILVTGGSGFIGSYLVKGFVDKKYEVTVFDNFSRGQINYLENYLDKVNLVNGDIRNYGDLKKAFNFDIDVVFHLAYINGTENFYNIPDQIIDVGIRGLLNVVDLAKEFSIKKLFLASSSEVYQKPNIIPTPESIQLIVPDVTNPRYTYGGGKILYEIYGLHYASKFIDKVIIFRPHNVYGPNMGFEHVIPQIIRKIYKAKLKGDGFIEMQGNGQQTRSFNYISDFCDGINILMKNDVSGIFNIGNDDEIKILKIYEIIAKKMHLECKFTPSIEPEGGTSRRCPDITKIKKLGYLPKVNLEDGISVTLDYYINYYRKNI